MPEVDDGFIEIGSGDTWDPQPGESVTGKFLDRQDDVGPNKSKLYTLRTDSGEAVVWGSTVLDDRMKRVALGDTVRITFTGLSKEKGAFGKPWKEYRVAVKEADGGTRAETEGTADSELEELGY